MAPHILVIGASGHIGAAVLQAVKAAHPELTIDALVRSESDGDHIRQLYQSSVSIVQGSLSDLDVVKTAASRAQIVINCGPDISHAASIAALLQGLSASPLSPTFYVHTSGAARIWDAPDGSRPGRIWDDVADVDALPADKLHAQTDRQVAAANSEALHTAVISPSFVMGRTPSPTHKAPVIFPLLMHAVGEVGGVFAVGAGANVVAVVDTEALAGLYAALVGDALRILSGDRPVDAEVWGPRAYYFGASMELPMRDFADKWLAPALRRAGAAALLGDGQVRQLTVERLAELMADKLGGGQEAALWSRYIAEGFGAASRVRGTRATRFLGYRWVEDLPGLDEAVEATLNH